MPWRSNGGKQELLCFTHSNAISPLAPNYVLTVKASIMPCGLTNAQFRAATSLIIITSLAASLRSSDTRDFRDCAAFHRMSVTLFSLSLFLSLLFLASFFTRTHSARTIMNETGDQSGLRGVLVFN